MASAVASTSSSRTSSVRGRLTTANVLAEIFNDSDSAESADDSDCDAVLFDSCGESQSEASDVAGDSDEEVAQVPQAKKRRGKAASQLRAPTCFVWSSGSPSTGQSSYQLLRQRRIQGVTVSSASPTEDRAQANNG